MCGHALEYVLEYAFECVCECLSGVNGLNTRRESEECGDTKTRQKKKKKSAYEFHGNVQEKIVRLGRAIFFY